MAQTTQGLISGRVISVRDSRPIPNAKISYTHVQSAAAGTGTVSESGWFVLPLLPPGVYRLRVEATEFQAQEVHQLNLEVAGTLDIEFRLRQLKDVWESAQRNNIFFPDSSVLVFFGPDVKLSQTTTVQPNVGWNGVLEATVSEVVDPVLIQELPLAGRDVYAALTTQPGVTSDAPTSRGLGLTVNGQRPSSSNFLLDGVENNNYLLSGPLTVVAPEAIQEYRVSINNFSAEFGRTAGVVANAVTRSGVDQWHGIGYFYFKHDVLNANDFQRNRVGAPRRPLRELHPGFSVGGPIKRKKLLASVALDQLGFRSRQDDQTIRLPSVQLIQQLKPGSVTANLFEKYSPQVVNGTGPCILQGEVRNEVGCSATEIVAPPSSFDQLLAMGRLDGLFNNGARRVFVRTNTSRVSRPDFSWSPYPDFVMPLNQNATSVALGWVDAARPGLTIEARGSWTWDDLRFDRPNSQAPGLAGPSGMLLPDSPLFFSYRNRGTTAETVGAVTMTQGRLFVKSGGGFLNRIIDGYQSTGADGYYAFASALGLATGQPSLFSVAVTRNGPDDAFPQYDREYRYRQWFGFFQGTWRASERFTINFGARYENFGAPTNVGQQKDTVVLFGNGATTEQSLKAATFFTPESGDQRLYDSDKNNWAGRTGLAYSLGANGRTVLRAAYGIFYDRLFDNLWQTIRNNAVELATFRFNGEILDLQTRPAVLPGKANRSAIFRSVTAFEPGLRTPYIQSYFFTVRRAFRNDLTVELGSLGSLGRKLIATDIINRIFGRANLTLPDVSYRSNQGNSNYAAATAVIRYRRRQTSWQVSYTWSHAIDNQTDPLVGEYGDLGFTGTSTGDFAPQASFSRQYDSRADRGDSIFDQRHNLVLLGTAALPGPPRGRGAARFFADWRFSWLAAARSGFPLSVAAGSDLIPGQAVIINNRANMLDPARISSNIAIPGGRLILNREAFSQGGGVLGNSGRNAVEGPGFWNVDFSIARQFSIRQLGESGRLVIRADAYNVLNHANLGVPDSFEAARTLGKPCMDDEATVALFQDSRPSVKPRDKSN